MRYRLLGPLQVFNGERPIDVGQGRRRSLLVLLLLHRNEAVLAERLIDEIWGHTPPATAAKSLQVCVSRLRRQLREAGADPAVIRTVAGGYELDADDDELDLAEVGRALPEARRAVAEGRPAEAVERAREALALWRGPALADVAFEDFAQAEIVRIEEQRLALLETKADGLIALGELDEAVEELETLVELHPTRERFCAQLMIALYRTGRQAEALEQYTRLRTMLVEQLGLEPSTELAALQTRMLRHDAALDHPVSVAAPPGESRGPPVAAAAAPAATRRPAQLILLASVLLAGAGVLAFVERRGGTTPPARGDEPRNVVVGLDAQGRREQVLIPVGGRPTDLAEAHGRLWVVTTDPGRLIEIAPRARAPVRVLPLGTRPATIAAGERLAWLASRTPGTLTRVRSTGARLVVHYGTVPGSAARAARTTLAVDHDGVWVSDGSSRLVHVAADGRRVTGVPVGVAIDDVTVAGHGVWAVSGARAVVLRIDARRPRITARVSVPGNAGMRPRLPARITAGPGAVWVLSGAPPVVTRISTRTARITDTLRLDPSREPFDVAADANTVWATNRDGTLSVGSPGSGAIRSMRLPHPVGRMVLAGGAAWVTPR